MHCYFAESITNAIDRCEKKLNGTVGERRVIQRLTCVVVFSGISVHAAHALGRAPYEQ
jgi:hypothetical protein